MARRQRKSSFLTETVWCGNPMPTCFWTGAYSSCTVSILWNRFQGQCQGQTRQSMGLRAHLADPWSSPPHMLQSPGSSSIMHSAEQVTSPCLLLSSLSASGLPQGPLESLLAYADDREGHYNRMTNSSEWVMLSSLASLSSVSKQLGKPKGRQAVHD